MQRYRLALSAGVTVPGLCATSHADAATFSSHRTQTQLCLITLPQRRVAATDKQLTPQLRQTMAAVIHCGIADCRRPCRNHADCRMGTAVIRQLYASLFTGSGSK